MLRTFSPKAHDIREWMLAQDLRDRGTDQRRSFENTYLLPAAIAEAARRGVRDDTLVMIARGVLDREEQAQLIAMGSAEGADADARKRATAARRALLKAV